MFTNLVILLSLFYAGPHVTVIGQICKVLSEGDVVTGTVKAVSDVGVFVRCVNSRINGTCNHHL